MRSSLDLEFFQKGKKKRVYMSTSRYVIFSAVSRDLGSCKYIEVGVQRLPIMGDSELYGVERPTEKGDWRC